MNLEKSNIGSSVTIFGRIWHKESNFKDNSIILYISDNKNTYPCQFNTKNIDIDIREITLETYVKVSGIISESKFETVNSHNLIIIGNDIQLLSAIALESDKDVRRNMASIRFLYIRKPEIKHILLIKQKIRKYLTEYLEDQGYSFFETPIITSLPQVNRKAIKAIISKPSNLYSENKYLIQKSQYYLEAFAHAFNKVYTITPAFRADHRESNFLLAEFWLLEVEEIFSTMKEQMNLVERALKYVASQLLIQNKTLLENLIKFRELERVYSDDLVISELEPDFWLNVDKKNEEYLSYLRNVNNKFPRLKYKDVEDFFKENGEFISTTHLREKRGGILTSQYNAPVFVYEFPFSKRHFYDKKCPNNDEYTHTFDLIGHEGYGEIASGGEREYRANIVVKQIKEKRLRLENNQTLQWYTQYKKYGSVPHGGFSIGLERLTAWLTRSDHISKVIGFPRRLVGTDLLS